MAITRSMEKGHDQPASKENPSSNVKGGRQKTSKFKALPRRRIVRENKVDRLTTLPLELFKMIMEQCAMGIIRTKLDYRNRRQYTCPTAQMANLRLVCKLFDVEITKAIFKIGRPVDDSNQHFWDRCADQKPLMIHRLLLEEALARPNVDIGILTLIQRVVSHMLHLRREDSEEHHRKYFEATCSCVFHSLYPTQTLWLLRQSINKTYRIRNARLLSLADDVIASCGAVAAWMGDLSLLAILYSKYGQKSISPAQKGHTGTAIWAAARNGQVEIFKYLRTIDGRYGRQHLYPYLSFCPLLAALRGHHVETFKEILPDYDEFVGGATRVGDGQRRYVGQEVARSGHEDIARIFWSHKSPYDTHVFSHALIHVCRLGQRNQTALARILVDAGASINEFCNIKRCTPLEACIAAAPPDVLQLLLQSGGNPKAGLVERYGSAKKYRSDPIMMALDCNKVEAMKVLLQHCRWETATRANVLLEAVKKGRLSMVETLVSPDHFDPTCSRRAANMGRAAVRQARADLRTDIVDLLLAHGCEN